MTSAKELLTIHAMFHNTKAFALFNWYNRRLVSSHAFHGAVVLVTLLPTMVGSGQMVQITQMLEDTLERFCAMSDLSPLCAKAAPVLRRLMLVTPATY